VSVLLLDQTNIDQTNIKQTLINQTSNKQLRCWLARWGSRHASRALRGSGGGRWRG
jgi:hypothetical protein